MNLKLIFGCKHTNICGFLLVLVIKLTKLSFRIQQELVGTIYLSKKGIWLSTKFTYLIIEWLYRARYSLSTLIIYT